MERINPPISPSQVLLGDILGKSLSDFIAQITPGVGLAYSTSMTTYNSYLALSAAKSAHSIRNSKQGLLPGDPTAAFLAVKTLIERERNACAANAGTHAIETTAKAAGIPFILLEDGYTEKKVSEIPHDHLIKDFIDIQKIISSYMHD